MATNPSKDAVQRALLRTQTVTGVPEAPLDGQQYARQSAGWSVVTGGGGGGTLEQGTGYFDIANDRLYITFGSDGSWEAIRFTSGVGDATTGTNQTGTKPTDLATLQGLTYT